MRNWSFRKSGVNYNFATTGGKHNQRKKLFHRLRNNINNRTIICETQARENEKRRERSSYKEHRANALASGADEGRD